MVPKKGVVLFSSLTIAVHGPNDASQHTTHISKKGSMRSNYYDGSIFYWSNVATDLWEDTKAETNYNSRHAIVNFLKKSSNSSGRPCFIHSYDSNTGNNPTQE